MKNGAWCYKTTRDKSVCLIKSYLYKGQSLPPTSGIESWGLYKLTGHDWWGLKLENHVEKKDLKPSEHKHWFGD